MSMRCIIRGRKMRKSRAKLNRLLREFSLISAQIMITVFLQERRDEVD